MSTYAAVLTGQGTSAIATIGILGPEALAILKRCFRPSSNRQTSQGPGAIRLGMLVDQQDQVIDQVIVGHEDTDLWAVHCHGSPLIVQQILQALMHHGAVCIEATSLLARYYRATGCDSIQIESRLAIVKARTIQAAQVIAGQASGGLRKTLLAWMDLGLDQVHQQAKCLLETYNKGKMLLNGLKVALIGPTNTGKSSILNRLVGQDRAMVCQEPYTTRDPVGAQLQLGPIYIELIDTAALDLCPDDPLVAAAAAKTVQLIDQMDLLVLVLDASRSIDQLKAVPINMIQTRPTLIVLNKQDLPERVDRLRLPWKGVAVLATSATTGAGIDQIPRLILQATGLVDLQPNTSIVFTQRQADLIKLLTELPQEGLKDQILHQLLHGPVEGAN